MPQPPPLMVKVVADRMKRDGVKQRRLYRLLRRLGRSRLQRRARRPKRTAARKLLTNERYARTDTSVTAQALKIVATKPDGVLDGGSATQGALPLLALRKRGYKGPFYGTPALLNADFVRVGGKAVEGVQVSAGPVIVAEQLPDDTSRKKIGTPSARLQKANGGEADDGFSGLRLRRLAGVPRRRQARDDRGQARHAGVPRRADAGDLSIKDLAGVTPSTTSRRTSYYGVDERSLVVVKLVDGKWKYEP